MNARTRKLKDELLAIEPRICVERARLVTDGYKANEALDTVLRRAKAFEKILTEMSVYIHPGELIVGNQASRPRAAPIFPEYGVRWIEKELDDVPRRLTDRFLISEEDKEQLRNIFEYWTPDRTTDDRVIALMPEELRKAEEMGAVDAIWLRQNGPGHFSPDFAKVLSRGLSGIVTEAREELERLDIVEPDYVSRKVFLESVIIALNAAITFARRFSKLAKDLADAEREAPRRAELEKIAQICYWVPANPARTFYEAIQSVWFIQLILQILDNGHSISPGRFDQYLYPFYERDLREGRMTRDEALELVECFWIKLNWINKLRSWHSTQYTAGYPMFQNLVVGGQTPDGRDATNELSYICIEATSNLALPQPSFSARYHGNCPEEFLQKCCELIKRGIGFPAFYNDEVIIPSLLNRGISREDAYDYCVVGCPEPSVHGKWAYRCNGGPFVIALKIFEMALNNGADPRTGYQLCPGKGDLTTFKSFQDVIEAWNTQRDYYVGLHVLYDHINDEVFKELVPDPFASALVADCIRRGKSIIEGGAIYDLVGGQTVGLANLANSLAAIKKLVFEDGLITGVQLIHALATNFEDEETRPKGEEIRQMLLNAPKYGNDDDYVDLLAKQVFLEYLQKYAKYKNARYGKGPIGGTFSPSTATVAANVPFGKKVGATPDGRKDGEELADGISPQYGTDVEGPTAVIKSVGKLDNILVSGGNLLNLKFTPSAFEGDAGTRNLAAFIKTFCRLKGFHVQFNVVSSDTLREAQKHPERHRNLLVRVAAYAAFFTSLDKEIQDAIIKRTEHRAMH